MICLKKTSPNFWSNYSNYFNFFPKNIRIKFFINDD